MSSSNHVLFDTHTYNTYRPVLSGTGTHDGEYWMISANTSKELDYDNNKFALKQVTQVNLTPVHEITTMTNL